MQSRNEDTEMVFHSYLKSEPTCFHSRNLRLRLCRDKCPDLRNLLSQKDFMISYEAPQWVQTNLLAALRVFVSAAIFRTPLMCLRRSPLINGMLPPLILFHKLKLSRSFLSKHGFGDPKSGAPGSRENWIGEIKRGRVCGDVVKAGSDFQLSGGRPNYRRRHLYGKYTILASFSSTYIRRHLRWTQWPSLRR